MADGRRRWSGRGPASGTRLGEPTMVEWGRERRRWSWEKEGQGRHFRAQLKHMQKLQKLNCCIYYCYTQDNYRCGSSFLVYMASESRRAVPRLIQWSGSALPDFKSTMIMNEGRSREPVRIGYKYIGQE